MCGYGARTSHVGIGGCVGSGELDDRDVRGGSLVGFENSGKLQGLMGLVLLMAFPLPSKA